MGRDTLTIFVITFIFLWVAVNIIIGASVEGEKVNDWETILSKSVGLSLEDGFGNPLEVGGVQVSYWVLAFITIISGYVIYRNLPVIGGGG